ncbi:MAG TPA: hypothetical protein PLG17_00640 [Thermodesulfobacteriota bacterium]|nr:hypothetical protein [Deltaproteobacteria bacterium]HNU70485.1 hypothetical protein [Thermodesulfobacteriota bacterium]HQO76997.1 hypothetical protein [Thermodesulfobacteriota bacterium]
MVNDWFVPARINRMEHESVFREHRVFWTPMVMIMDQEGREHFRFTGFLPPTELCARLILDGAKIELSRKDFKLADKCLREVVETYKGTFAAPEAVYYQAVSHYMQRHDASALKKGLETLRQQFPHSEWALRAKPYELIH